VEPIADREHQAALTHLECGAQELPDSIEGLKDSIVDLKGPKGNPAGSNTAESRVYPTDSKERQNAQKKLDKEAGITREVRKKPKFVEDHSDDCGESLASLSTGQETDVESLHFVDSDSSDYEDDNICENIELCHFWGGHSTPRHSSCESPTDHFYRLGTYACRA